MSELPKFIETLVQRNRIANALAWCESDEERLSVLELADEEVRTNDRAREVAREICLTQPVERVEVHKRTAVVYAGKFRGTHQTRRDRYGDLTPVSIGTYVHEPSGVEFECECPDELQLIEAVEDVSSVEAPDAAAKAEYRRTRL